MTVQILLEEQEGVAAPQAAPEEAPDSDTSSESDTEQISDIREMRDIIARMDDDDDGGDQDKYAACTTQPSFIFCIAVSQQYTNEP